MHEIGTNRLITKVRRFDHSRLPQLGRSPGQRHPSSLENIPATSQFECQTDVLLDEEDGEAALR